MIWYRVIENKMRLYAKEDAKSLYNEYKVLDWDLSNKGLELDLA